MERAQESGSAAVAQALGLAKAPEKRRMGIKEARPFIEEQELAKLIDALDVTREVITFSVVLCFYFMRSPS